MLTKEDPTGMMQDYTLLRNVFGSQQIDDLIEQAKGRATGSKAAASEKPWMGTIKKLYGNSFIFIPHML